MSGLKKSLVARLLFCCVIGLICFAANDSFVWAQGSVGVGRLPRTSSEIRRTLKTILIVKTIKPDQYTFTAKDEITNEELTYNVSRSAKINAEKGFFSLRKKELKLSDITPGQRLEVLYRESLPTQITSIKVLKPKS